MNTIIWIMTCMVLANLARMTKDDIEAWFAEQAQPVDEVQRIDHIRAQPGKWCRITSNKWTFATLGALHGAGFSIPGYLMERPGWEPKKALLAKTSHLVESSNDYLHEGWALATFSAIKHTEQSLVSMMVNSQLQMFIMEKDQDLTWWTPNPEFEVEPDLKIETMQFTWNRSKTGHDGTERTAPYTPKKTDAVKANCGPLVTEK